MSGVLTVRSAYANLYERLVAGSSEPENEQACWLWKHRRDNHGYPLINVWVPALGRAATLKAHIALWVWLHAKCECADDLFLQYKTLTLSGLELDHLCMHRCCVNPDHMLLSTPKENCARRVYTYWR